MHNMNSKLICLHMKFLFESKGVRIVIIFIKLSKWDFFPLNCEAYYKATVN